MANEIVTFGDPPVTEVVVALHFRPVDHLTVAHLGVLWRDVLASVFPHVEERSPYEPPIERFDGPVGAGFSLRMDTRHPSPRLWCKSADDQELLQLQRDWFACNWRKVQPEAEYGRWPSRRAAFERWYRQFEHFVATENLGDVQPMQCEVTYINHITPNSAWTHHGQLDRLLTTIGRPQQFLPEPEEVGFRSSYVIAPHDEPLGRLHVQCDPVLNTKDGSPAYLLNLTARGRPLSGTLDGALEFFDLGREWIVKGFMALTTQEAQDAWGRRS